MKTLITAFVLVLTLNLPCVARGYRAAPPDTVEITTHRVYSTASFYGPLLPYGQWIIHRTYGKVWRPYITFTVRSWRPYCSDGRWLWTEHGWYWHSCYPWGWAVFHYGRWVRTPEYGWVWVPGTDWSPAWVCWRYSDRYCGWAPMPPDHCCRSYCGSSSCRCSASMRITLDSSSYVFVPVSRFTHRNICEVAVSDCRRRYAYRKTRTCTRRSCTASGRTASQPPRDIAGETVHKTAVELHRRAEKTISSLNRVLPRPMTPTKSTFKIPTPSFPRPRVLPQKTVRTRSIKSRKAPSTKVKTKNSLSAPPLPPLPFMP
ncbi:MAG: DUF6600 domain-containing protein [Kiritimatiellia bacterium]